MELQLKKQRNRLILRVTLILTAVWLAVSTAFSAICINSEKYSIQNQVIADLSNAHFKIAMATDSLYNLYYHENEIYLSIVDLICYKNSDKRDWNTQLKVSGTDKNTTYLDTTSKIYVKYGIKSGTESYKTLYGFIEYNTIRKNLTNDQFESIGRMLNTQRKDGKKYELVCTKFHIYNTEFIPLELQIVLVEDENNWFISDKIIDKYTLDNNRIDNISVSYCNEMRRNIIPKEFLFANEYNNDYLSLLNEEQLEQTVETVYLGGMEYVFYASDYIFLKEYDDESLINNKDSYNGTSYIIQYAKKADLLDNCKAKLTVGISVIFAFFFIIAIILCLLIWKIVKSQIIEEQRRTDLTNALAHDIKTPLFVISGYAYSLKEDIDSNERDGYLEKIIEQTDEINQMVHKMLNLSKLSLYNTALNREDFDLFVLVKDISSNYSVLKDNKKIEISHNGDHTVNGDKELIKTAVSNLYDNAVKYSLKNSTIKINVNGKTLCIENKSEPLTKNELKQIWQPYVRKDESRHKTGNGLGLSIVKTILELHDAKYEMSMKDSTLKCLIKFST